MISGRSDVAGAVTRHEGTGLHVLAGRSGSGALSSLQVPALDVLLTRLKRETAQYDYILLDLGAFRISSGQIVAVLVILLLTFVNSRGPEPPYSPSGVTFLTSCVPAVVPSLFHSVLVVCVAARK